VKGEFLFDLKNIGVSTKLNFTSIIPVFDISKDFKIQTIVLFDHYDRRQFGWRVVLNSRCHPLFWTLRILQLA